MAAKNSFKLRRSPKFTKSYTAASKFERELGLRESSKVDMSKSPLYLPYSPSDFIHRHEIGSGEAPLQEGHNYISPSELPDSRLGVELEGNWPTIGEFNNYPPYHTQVSSSDLSLLSDRSHSDYTPHYTEPERYELASSMESNPTFSPESASGRSAQESLSVRSELDASMNKLNEVPNNDTITQDHYGFTVLDFQPRQHPPGPTGWQSDNFEYYMDITQGVVSSYNSTEGISRIGSGSSMDSSSQHTDFSTTSGGSSGKSSMSSLDEDQQSPRIPEDVLSNFLADPSCMVAEPESLGMDSNLPIVADHTIHDKGSAVERSRKKIRRIVTEAATEVLSLPSSKQFR
jgi:hypothetical protein